MQFQCTSTKLIIKINWPSKACERTSLGLQYITFPKSRGQNIAGVEPTVMRF